MKQIQQCKMVTVKAIENNRKSKDKKEKDSAGQCCELRQPSQ